jgi:hypothetical protein
MNIIKTLALIPGAAMSPCNMGVDNWSSNSGADHDASCPSNNSICMHWYMDL